MSATIGDGMVALALAGGIVGYGRVAYLLRLDIANIYALNF